MVEESHSLGSSQQVPDSTFSNVCDLSVALTSNCAWPDVSRILYLGMATGKGDRRAPVISWQCNGRSLIRVPMSNRYLLTIQQALLLLLESSNPLSSQALVP